MKLTNEFEPIRDWANNKKIITEGNVFRQYTKFQEEAGELAKGLIKNSKEEIIDAIGDVVVTLVSLAGQVALLHKDPDISIEDCINTAYNEIKNRTGKCIDGDFIKDTQPTLAESTNDVTIISDGEVKHCCSNEYRSIDGGCSNCGDPAY